MVGEEESDKDADRILSVRRLRGIRGAFVWDELGPRAMYHDGETTLTVHCFEQNGLPYISWEDFKPIRVLLARDWKSKGNARVKKIEDGVLQIRDYMPTVEAVGKVQEESAAAPAASVTDAGEKRAEELCSKSTVTFDEVWSAVRLASLVERRTDRMKQVDNEDAKTLPLWTVGLFVHGGVLGVTSETRRHPWLVRLLRKLVRQQEPDLEFLSLSMAINLVFRPHRDRNSLERESVVLGLSWFQGGQLWIEGLPGELGNTAIRHIDNGGQQKPGRVHELSHKCVRFNAAVRMHGTEPFQGVRGVAVDYTPRGNANNIEQGGSRLEAECKSIIPELPSTEIAQGPLEGDVVQGVTHVMQGTQDFGDWDLQGVRAASVQSPDDDDDEEGLQLEGFMACEIAAKEVIDLTAPTVRPGPTLKDYEARGLRRPHRKVTADQISKGVLSIDLAGPYVAAYDGTKYALVAVFRIDEHTQLHFMRRQRDATLNCRPQGKLPDPGDLLGQFLCQSDTVVQGSLVLVNRAGQEHLITTRLPAVIDKKPEQWRTHVTPLGDLIWVSSLGQVRDGEVVRDTGVDLGMLTVEEREQGQHAEQGFPFVAFASAENHSEEEPTPVNHMAKKRVAKADDKADRYKILSYEVEQEMNKAEVKVAQLVIDTIDARVLSDPQTPADEKLKWVNEGLSSELQTLYAKEIYEEWDEADVPPGATVLPSKVVLTKKPVQDDAEADINEPLSTWRAKARIVVWSATCLAGNPSWTGLVLDITAAFLNAKMDNEHTFVRPPKVLSREGLVEPSKVWRLRRLLYGLRKGPKLWEACRNEELDGKTFAGEGGAMYFLDPISSGVWAIRKKGEPQSFCGIFDMYVDDGVIVGPVALLCKALAELLLSIWQLKIQGFLPSDELEIGAKVQVGDKQVAVRKELQFLGVVIKRTGEGVALLQHSWVDTELERRGWATFKGACNLPEIVEGQTEPAPRDDAYGADLHRAQSEVGSLFWLGLRSRPDLLATIGALSCMGTVGPRRTYKLATNVWRYVAGTRDKVLFFKAGTNLNKAKLGIYGDASLAPVASRSRTGVVVKFGDHVTACRTQRQFLTAYSAFEAEVEAAATAYQLGTQVKLFLDKFLQRSVETELFGDNSASVGNLTKGSEYVQTTRTRHFGMRCSYLRAHLRNDGIPMLHMSGEPIPADGLTKTLSRVKLESSREKLNVL
ncbi:RE2 [Symbiodinium sp. CCMP2592]|nr:RE2 [Symbiodinium sp. CCMP2592]